MDPLPTSVEAQSQISLFMRYCTSSMRQTWCPRSLKTLSNIVSPRPSAWPSPLPPPRAVPTFDSVPASAWRLLTVGASYSGRKTRVRGKQTSADNGRHERRPVKNLEVWTRPSSVRGILGWSPSGLPSRITRTDGAKCAQSNRCGNSSRLP